MTRVVIEGFNKYLYHLKCVIPSPPFPARTPTLFLSMNLLSYSVCTCVCVWEGGDVTCVRCDVWEGCKCTCMCNVCVHMWWKVCIIIGSE